MASNENPVIVGLDIGTTKVVAIAGRKNAYGKLEIVGFGKAESMGVTHGVVMNIEQCINSIKLAIDRCIASNPQLDIKKVYVGIAGQHIKSLQTRGDRIRTNGDDIITRQDIEALIRDQHKIFIPAGDQIIDIVPQEFTVDNVLTTSPLGMNGVKIGANFHIVTADRNAIKNMSRCVTQSDLAIQDLVLQPLASAAAVVTPEDMEAGVAIVDIGGGTTDMAVFCDGILKHTAVIPYAGVNITYDIRQGLHVLRAQAEQLKVQFGCAIEEPGQSNQIIAIPGLRGFPKKEISVANLSRIIQPRMQEIMEIVMLRLQEANLQNKLYGGIILTGGGALLKHVVQMTEYVTGMSTRIGYPNEHLAGEHSEALMNPMYSTCIGLILRGFSDLEQNVVRIQHLEEELRTQSTVVPNTPAPTPEPVAAPTPETLDADAEVKDKPAKKKDPFINVQNRKRHINKLFEGWKDKFIKIFEEDEDKEIK